MEGACARYAQPVDARPILLGARSFHSDGEPVDAAGWGADLSLMADGNPADAAGRGVGLAARPAPGIFFVARIVARDGRGRNYEGCVVPRRVLAWVWKVVGEAVEAQRGGQPLWLELEP